MNPEKFMWHRRGPSLVAVVGALKKVPMSIMMSAQKALRLSGERVMRPDLKKFTQSTSLPTM